ncbi:MAG: iron ABC transporter permease, partial [Pseudomonadota bacterium]
MSSITAAGRPARPPFLARYNASPIQAAALIVIALFLLAFMVVPLLRVIVVAFTDPNGGFGLVHFGDFFRTGLLREAFWNSIYVGAMTVIVASLIAVPLATIISRFNFRGAALIHTLGVVPLVMPPFVGAVAMQLIYGRNGSINLLLMDWFGFRIPFMEGLNGVIFVEALHYFPFILLNLSASLSNIDSAMEESAQNLGARGFTLFRRIVFPLALPGYLAGAALVFVKVFDDLATPLLLNVTNMLAPQAYLKITTVGVTDPMGYVISVIMIICSLGAMVLSALALRGRDYATQQRGGGGLSRRQLGKTGTALAAGFVILALAVSLSPHIGIFLLSIATVWSYDVLPDAYTLAHYGTVFREAGPLIGNTILYCGLAGLIDVVLGATLAYIVLRTKLPGRRLVEQMAMAAVAVPGLVLGIGLLRTYYDVKLPWSGESFATFWFMLVIAYSIRRLPYALTAASAALQQLHVSLEEAAENLGAGKASVLSRIVVPLMTGGLLAGFVTSFATAAVELSATLLLVARAPDAPLAYGIYVYMQSAAGRGPGAA